ncbi:trypsin [Pilimelia terevasa]|uniref:Trypsin n=1 Tax=Pilimelia terevasa TaxID=53372 RepID=A0A8J3FIF2_9ACTN|nr:serine protease [Pilimelia terevasa]GGK33325.1 trypsin [Pilimelia terevasa]
MTSRKAIAAISAGIAASIPVAPPAPASAAPAPAAPGDTRIVGGAEAAAGAYPWMTYVTVGYRGMSRVCGGALVSADIVLTAQHCLADSATHGRPTSLTADIGALDHTAAAQAGTRRFGGKYLLGAGVGAGDWAVIKLTRPLKARSRPVLPADEAYDAKKTMRALGWGSTNESGRPVRNLREVDLPYAPAAACGRNAHHEICAGDLANGGVDTCHGDGGGPLLAAALGGRWVQVGITSHGFGCGRVDHPGHYTRVSAFTAKIQAAITLLDGEAAQTTAP